MTPILHRDGTCTYELYGHRYRTSNLPDERTMELLQPADRRRIALHLTAHGDVRAQAWLDGHPRRTDAWASAPNDLRNRPAIRVTLARDVLARLDALALRWGVPRSRAIERRVNGEDACGVTNGATCLGEPGLKAQWYEQHLLSPFLKRPIYAGPFPCEQLGETCLLAP